MSHPAHKIAGPMLRHKGPFHQQHGRIATPEEVSHALSWPQAAAPTVVHDEWVNEAKRRNGLKGSSEVAGYLFRTERDLRARRRPVPKTWAEKRTHKNFLQRLARRITRLFRK